MKPVFFSFLTENQFTYSFSGADIATTDAMVWIYMKCHLGSSYKLLMVSALQTSSLDQFRNIDKQKGGLSVMILRTLKVNN